MWWIGCGASPEPPARSDAHVPADSAAPAATEATTATGSTGETGATWDCGFLPPAPLPAQRLDGPPASEDFAFDRTGHLVSFEGSWITRSEYPPGAVTPWVPIDGDGSGPASIRALPGGDFVYHDVTTSTLYRVGEEGGVVPVFSGFGYAGGIEVFSDDLVYVVDYAGLQLIGPTTGERSLFFDEGAPWLQPNGISLSPDYQTLFVSARDGIWAIALDGDGRPRADPVAWAPPPAGATELLGMGVDVCGNLYVTGSAASVSTLWRYEAGGKNAPEVLLERPDGWLSNVQWGSGQGGWDPFVLYVVDRRAGAPGYDAVEVGLPEKDRR